MMGAFIPSVLYPFSSLTPSAAVMQVVFATRGALYNPRLNDLEVVIKQGNFIKIGHYEGHIAVPYHYIVASGVMIAFLGISLVALIGRKNRKENE